MTLTWDFDPAFHTLLKIVSLRFSDPKSETQSDVMSWNKLFMSALSFLLWHHLPRQLPLLPVAVIQVSVARAHRKLITNRQTQTWWMQIHKANWRPWWSLSRIERQNRAKSKLNECGIFRIKFKKQNSVQKYHKERLRNQSCESYQEGKLQQKCETVHSGKVQHQVESKYTEVPLNWQDAPLTI